ncbi:hypothetical protein BH10ACT1_BH10ACT1_06850 [soil metagenome]
MLPARRSRPRLLRRPLAVLAAAALGALAFGGLISSSAPAGAVSQGPTLSLGFQCASNVGGESWISIGNVGGSGPVDFAIVRTGHAPEVRTLGIDSTDTIYTPIPENSTFSVSVTATGGLSSSDTWKDVDCYTYVGAITLSCDGDQPVLTGAADRNGGISTYVTFDDGTATQSEDGNIPFFTSHVAEDQPFSASMATDQDGVFATLEGTPDCVTAVPVTTTTMPSTTTTMPPTTTSTTVPDTTTSTTQPDPTTTTSTTLAGTTPTVPGDPTDPSVPSVPTDPSSVAGAGTDAGPVAVSATPAPAGTVLPRTGSDVEALAVLGFALLGIGCSILRYRRDTGEW